MGEAAGRALGDHKMGYVTFARSRKTQMTGGYGATGATEATKRQETKLEAKEIPLPNYIALLSRFEPEASGDLPPVPPFNRRPERPIAWSAWWDAVEKGRRIL